ncbi:MAG: LytTR family DNA-binding domain-containing protein [Bacteroidota bacterium]
MDRTIHTVDTGIFDIGWRMATIRYGVVAFIAFCFAHIFSHQMPLVGDYHFPYKMFLAILGMGGVVCSGSWGVTLLYRNRIFSDKALTLNRVLRFIGINFITVSLLYTVVQFLVFRGFSGPGFAIGLFVIGLLAVIENLSFLLVSSRQYIPIPTKFTVPLGKKELVIPFEEVAFFRLSDGVIYLFTVDGKKIATVLGSMESLEKSLPPAVFYRANRQYIVQKEAVHELIKMKNRKLGLTLNTSAEDEKIVVSRYKSKDLKKWMLKI